MSKPKVAFAVLPQADGSVSYSWQGFEVIASVNGPIEPQRRDEIPDEACLEVNVRQANGAGAPRDRHTESLLHATLRDIVYTAAHPATLIQITLQILATPPLPRALDGAPLQSDTIIPELPHLLNASVYALLEANIPLTKVCTAVGVTVEGSMVSPGCIKQSAESMHVFAFSSQGEMLLAQSEGPCDVETWFKSAKLAEETCIGKETRLEESLLAVLRETMGEEINLRTKWRANA